jgi:hypothetical protein
MSQVITTALKEMKARQKELQPLAAEFRQVESAIQALEAVDGGSKPAPRGPGRRRATGRRRGRPRKGERTRAEQFFALVQEHPGVTIGEAAEHMSVQPNYLYRVVAQLESDGTVERRARAIYPTPPKIGPSASVAASVDPPPLPLGLNSGFEGHNLDQTPASSTAARTSSSQSRTRG